MSVLLQNDQLRVAIKARGAELTSILLLADGTEYLWQGDPAIWREQAPMLFPIVGALAGRQFVYRGHSYAMPAHGFARHAEFAKLAQSGHSVTWRLTDSPATFTIYPFRFWLDVTYTLRDNSILVEYAVTNRDDGEMYFSIGGHPGFNCPLQPDESYSDYYLEFGGPETLDRLFIDPATHLIAPETDPMLRQERIIALRPDLFDHDALIFAGCQSASLTLRSHRSGRQVIMDFPGFTHLGIWARPGAPYVCIEPWYGVDDDLDFAGELPERRGIQKLEPGGVFTCRYRMAFT